MKMTLRVLISIACVTGMAISAAAQDYDKDAEPKDRAPGVIPPQANHSGYCRVMFDVQIDGTIANIRVTECSDNIV